MEKEWFERWFGEEYKRLYPHRDAAQAATQADAVIRSAGAGSSWNVLDVGCGAGRHLRAFRARGFRAAGVDRSAVLLRDARAAGLDVVRADMRRLPFPDGTFDLAASFFTSFGYFDSMEEDAAALREFARVTRAGGRVFLDLPNPPQVLRNLVPSEIAEAGGLRAEIARSVEGGRVIKRIRIVRPHPRTGEAREERYEERVRLYSREDLEPVLANLGLETAAVLGDEGGAPFDPQTSSRMSLLLRRTA